MATETTKPQILDGDVVRAMTDNEYTQWKADCDELQVRTAAIEAAAAAKASAYAKLKALGLTDVEIAALVG